MSGRPTFDVDCVLCFDRGVIHFTDLAPSNRHEPVAGVRPVPLRGRVCTRDGLPDPSPVQGAEAEEAEGRG